jgi:DnaJ-class molecular chaperone
MKKVCNECHGSGQLSYFKGESRFVLSQDECPACCGLGFIEIEQDAGQQGEPEDEPQNRQ